jgi:hypothetical protein
MPTVAIAPFTLNNATLTIGGANEYAGSVSTAKFEPDYQPLLWTGINGAVKAAVPANGPWKCSITLAQDLATATSLQNYLLANAGSSVVAVLTPIVGGKTVTATITLVPPAIGGDVSAIQTASITMISTPPVIA